MRRRLTLDEYESKSKVNHEIEFVESIEEVMDQNQNQSQSCFSGWIFFLIIIIVFLFWAIDF